MTTPTNTTEGTPADNGNTAATTGQTSGPDLKELLALQDRVAKGDLIEVSRYQGLQGTLTKEQAAKQAAMQEAAGLKQQLEALNATKATLETQLAELTEFKTKTEPVLTAKESELVRLKLIVTEYPALAEFEAAGILPTASTEEELKQKFSAFSEKIGNLQKQAGQQFRVGAAPETPVSKENKGDVVPDGASVLKALQAEAFNLAFQGKAVEYEAKQKEIAAFKAKQGMS